MIKVWGRPNSICTQRVLWTCVEAGLAFELQLASATMGPHGHVSTGAQPYGTVDSDGYRAMNPNGTIPTIEDGTFVLWESNAIVTYLAAKYAPHQLYGNSIETLATASQWMAWTNERLEPQLHTLVMELFRKAPAQRSPAAVAEAARAMAPWATMLDQHLSLQAYVAGAQFTIGDVPTGAAAHRWKQFAIERPPTPHLDTWLERLAAREGFQRHVQPAELHLG